MEQTDGGQVGESGIWGLASRCLSVLVQNLNFILKSVRNHWGGIGVEEGQDFQSWVRVSPLE